jgi:hypothetical protein
VRIARQRTSLLQLLLWRNVRQASQVLVQTDRTDHPQDVWCLSAGGILVGSFPFCLGEHVRERAHAKERYSDATQAKNSRN